MQKFILSLSRWSFNQNYVEWGFSCNYRPVGSYRLYDLSVSEALVRVNTDHSAHSSIKVILIRVDSDD